MPHFQSVPAANLNNCDIEPIHIPGAIMPHGFLLALNEQDKRIAYVSANIHELTDISPDKILNKQLGQVFGPQLALYMQDIVSRKDMDLGRPVELIAHQMPNGRKFRVLLHWIAGYYIVEFEPLHHESVQSSFRWLDGTQQNLVSKNRLKDLLDEAAREIKKLTGYDRVMIYKFHPDMHGEVVAEACNPDLEPYLGLHYPASDIPKQARKLYLTNWTRMLVDVEYTPVPLLAPKNTSEPLNLSSSALRSFSPLHLEYLQNMGVMATLTISIVKNNSLWGLIACHHYLPKFTGFQTRNFCELVGRLLSVFIPQKEQQEFSRKLMMRQSLLKHISSCILNAKDPLKGLLQEQEDMVQLLDADGFALISGDKTSTFGVTPPPRTIAKIKEWYKRYYVEKIFYTDCFQEACGEPESFRQVFGLMMAGISPHSEIYLLYFRNEKKYQIHWAGNPEKAVIQEGDQVRISPRKSFQKYTQGVQKRSQDWEKHQVELLKQLVKDAKDALLKKHWNTIKEFEILMHEIYEQAKDALFLQDFASLQINDCNQSALKLLEAHSKNQVLGTSIFHFLAMGPDAPQTAHYRKELQNLKTVTFDVEVKTLGGKLVWTNFSASIIEYADRKIILVRLKNIAERKKQQMALEEANSQLTVINEELDRFVYSTSHDLRAPVCSMLGLIELSRNADNIEEILGYMETGQRVLNRLDRFIMEILEYSRNSRTELQNEEIDLYTLLQEIMENYSWSEEYRGVEKRVEINQLARLHTDPYRLKIILNNLVSNAFKYSASFAAKPLIRVSATINSQHLQVSVTDNGTGIPEDMQKHVFDMFFRADNYRPGSGLGLYIVQEALKKMSGEIHLQSTLEKGSTFTIKIPNGKA